ncbi:MAG: MMPL family transporter [Pseudomonadota bacterium]
MGSSAQLSGHGRAFDFFSRILVRPRLLLTLAAVVFAVGAAGLPGVVKDPSVDAFVPSNHPAAVARDEAKTLFGLEDPMVVALAAPKGQSIFTPEGLGSLRALHEALRVLEGVKKNDVMSLASENAFWGNNGDLAVEPILPQGTITQEAAQTAQQRAALMPVLTGLLISEAQDLAMIVVPVEDANHAEEVYAAVLKTSSALTPAGYETHVAGVAAMNARLADMVSVNTKRFIPLAVVLVLSFLFVALGSPKAILAPFGVIVGAAALGIGAMGWVDARYYLITSALPVVIMAIAVADSVHICSFYLAARREDETKSAREAAAMALARTWLPVCLTSLTTIAGFIGLSFGAAMRPISEFGIFAAIGVLGALIFSLTLLPALLVLMDLKPTSQPGTRHLNAWMDSAASAMTRLAIRAPGSVLSAICLLLVVMGVFASQAQFDYERKRYFLADEPVRIADQVIADRLGGINFLDVVVTAPEEGGLLSLEALSAIGELKASIAALPHVVKVSGIDDYIHLMHTALTGAPAGTLPERAAAPAQYMFLYEASAPPDDFKQEIDYLQQNALIRAQLSTDSFQKTGPVVSRLDAEVRAWAGRHGLGAAVSGRVAVNDGWMSLLAHNHFRGLGLAALLVWLAALVSFRAVLPSILVMVPVFAGVLSIYAMMGLLGITIAPATSMMAAISTGLGVDFGVHLMAHVRRARKAGKSWSEAFSGHYILVVRACFYSAAALALALSVLVISTVPVLRWFGLLIATGAIGSLFGAMFILPALQLSALRWRKGAAQNA